MPQTLVKTVDVPRFTIRTEGGPWRGSLLRLFRISGSGPRASISRGICARGASGSRTPRCAIGSGGGDHETTLLAPCGSAVRLRRRGNPEELEELGTVEGYTNIPIDQLADRLDELPKDKPILTA